MAGRTDLIEMPMLERLLDRMLKIAKEANVELTPQSSGFDALAGAFQALDRHMHAGGDLPARWAERRPRCRGSYDRPREVTNGPPVIAARCERMLGHGGNCGPRKS